MPKNVLNEYVLMLNKSWVPVDTCTVRSAFGRIFMETARFMDTAGDAYTLHDIESWIELPVTEEMASVHTSRTQIRVPEILVLRSDIVPRRRVMQFSRRNLARRDRLTCQYCGSRPGPQQLTMDHVVPKSKGGQSTWTNCVLSCLDCNSKKADKPLEEVGMQLRMRPEMRILHPADKHKWSAPYRPAWSPVFRVNASSLKESWKKFLPDRMLDSIRIS